MGLTQYYTATTLDGFIADPDNSLAWLFTRQQEPGGPLTYDAFIADVGAIAMGRTTYEWIVDHEFSGKDPSEWRWPYDVPCWVFTNHDLQVVPDAPITFTRGEVATIHGEMVAAAGGRNVWIVGGGELAGEFADVGPARRGDRLDRVGHARRRRAAPAPQARAPRRGAAVERRLSLRAVLGGRPASLSHTLVDRSSAVHDGVREARWVGRDAS